MTASCAAPCAAVLLASACALPLRPARLDVAAPRSPREEAAAARSATARCDARFGLLFPGVAQACRGQSGEATVLASLGGLEAGAAGVAALTGRRAPPLRDPAVVVPLVAYGDALAFGVSEALLDEQRAAGLRYVPQDTPRELLYAPFNPAVLGEPDVWLGIVGLAGLAAGLSVAVDPAFRAGGGGATLDLFGRKLDAEVGYPVATAMGSAVFLHVALAEEAMFRGLLQSAAARRLGPWQGWLVATAIFGALHAPNALLLPEDQRLPYLWRDLPFITAVGAYFGLSYLWNDYSLAAPVAIHFWYDLALTLLSYWRTGEAFPFSAAVVLPW